MRAPRRISFRLQEARSTRLQPAGLLASVLQPLAQPCLLPCFPRERSLQRVLRWEAVGCVWRMAGLELAFSTAFGILALLPSEERKDGLYRESVF